MILINCRQKTFKISLLLIVIFLCTGCASKQQKQAGQAGTGDIDSLGWTVLFDGESLNDWEVTQFGPQGPVYVTEGSIVLGMGDGCTGITYKKDFPRIKYEVNLEAKKISGNDFFCGITFPVNESYCSFIAGGWGGPVVGLSSIDGLDASENETRILKKFDHGKWYKITVKVTEEEIGAWIDDQQVVEFVHTGRQLSVRPEVNLSKPFGICSWTTTAALRNIRVRVIE